MTENLLADDRIITGRQLADREAASEPLPPALADLWRFLDRHCRGHDNAMRSERIAVRLGLFRYDRLDRVVTDKNGCAVGDGKRIVHMVSSLVTDYAKPVASVCSGDHRGLFVAVSRQEKEIETRSIDSRIIALARRKRAFDAAPIEQRPPRQGEMFEA